LAARCGRRAGAAPSTSARVRRRWAACGRAAPELYVDHTGRPRLHVTDGALTADLPVTDLRLFEPDQFTLRPEAVDLVAERLRRGTEVLLSVGLTRPWQKPDDTVERHWLQVNNIHLADNPIWDGELP
jgi:hypothetical protein